MGSKSANKSQYKFYLFICKRCIFGFLRSQVFTYALIGSEISANVQERVLEITVDTTMETEILVQYDDASEKGKFIVSDYEERE